MATLPTGQISISDINTEFGLGNNLGAYRGVTWYTDTGGSGTFTNTNLGMDQFWGKRATPPVSISLSGVNGGYFNYPILYDGFTVPYEQLHFYNDGTWASRGGVTGNWASPTTAGVGSNYWLRYTLTSTTGSGTNSGSSGWLALSSTRSLLAQKSDANVGIYNATYTIQIASDSGGSTIVATAYNVTLSAEVTSFE